MCGWVLTMTRMLMGTGSGWKWCMKTFQLIAYTANTWDIRNITNPPRKKKRSKKGKLLLNPQTNMSTKIQLGIQLQLPYTISKNNSFQGQNNNHISKQKMGVQDQNAEQQENIKQTGTTQQTTRDNHSKDQWHT